MDRGEGALMLRTDLLSLTDDDLELLKNRGTVKRARREIDADETPYELTVDQAGNVTVKWAEGFTSTLPAGKSLKSGRCSCPEAGLCRHMIRSVFAYQKDFGSAPQSGPAQAVVNPALANTAAPADDPAALDPATATPANGSPACLSEDATPDVPASSWDPGELSSDESVRKVIRNKIWEDAQTLLRSGQIVELSRGRRPFAKFHTLAHSIRFITANSILNAHCDCQDMPSDVPCVHVPLAILAFGLLAKDQRAGIVSTMPRDEFTDHDLVSDIEESLAQLFVSGVVRAPHAALGRLKRTVENCLSRNYYWPAEILNEIIVEIERYHQRDARYSAQQIAMLIAECAVRLDAIKNDTGEIPLQFVRGFSSDHAGSVAKTLLVGLGCGAEITRRGTRLTGYVQDLRSGNLLTIKREFSHKSSDDNLPKFAYLGEKPIFQAMGVATIAKGQLTIQGGKLTSSRAYDPARAKISFKPQHYQWEKLRPPVCVDSFAELRAVLNARFPSYVSARYSGRNFFVCNVSAARGAHFNEADQTIEATVFDSENDLAELIFPYLTTCAEGADALLHHLETSGEALRYLAGHVQIGRSGITIVPVSLIFDDGRKRTMVQPWVDRRPGDVAKTSAAETDPAEYENWQHGDVILAHFSRIFEEMGTTLNNGLQFADSQTVATWTHVLRESESLGFSELPDLIQTLVKELERKQVNASWEANAALSAALNVTILTLIAQEEVLRSP